MTPFGDDQELLHDNLELKAHFVTGLDKPEAGFVNDSEAAEYVDPTLVISEEENSRLKKRVLKNLLPIMCIAYITQALDKGTLQQSVIMGWQDSVHAEGQDYALTTTFLWVGIMFGEPIVNQFIRRLPVAKVLGTSMVIWSTLVLGLAFSLNVPGAWAIRLLLGLFESSFNPCLITITVQWFKATEQTMIVTIWQAMFAAASFISNLIAYGFYSIHGAENLKTKGLYAWQWMTTVIAMFSFVSSAIVLLFLPDSPVKARWASESEKSKFIERIRVNDQGIKQKVWRSSQAREILTDPLPWLLFGMIFLVSCVVGGLNTFNSLLIKQAFGFTTGQALLLGLPLAVFQVVLYFLIGYLGTQTGQTVFCMIGYTAVNIMGSIILITVKQSPKTRGGLLVAFYLMQCFQSLNPSVHAMLSRNVAGQTKKSIVYAMFFVGWAGGNAIGPQIFQSTWSPQYRNSLYIHLGIYGLFLADILTARYICKSRNDKRDRAMEGGENVHAHAFEDMTDLQNPDFRYSY